MATVAGNWNGRLFGTNTGNLSARIAVEGDVATGEIRLLDDVFGPVVYQLTGTWDGNLIALKGTGVPSSPGVVVGEVSIEGSLAADGRLIGTWTSNLGTGGSFHLFPGPSDAEAAHIADSQAPPEELHIIQDRIGAVRLYRQDVVALCELILSDLNSDRLAVRFQNGPTQSVLWSDVFIDTVSAEGIPFVRLSINDTAPGAASRLVTVELGANYNEIIVQGESQVWVAGKAQVLRDFLSKRQNHLVTGFKVWNVNLLTILLLAMIVWMPSFGPLWARAAFGITIAAVVTLTSFLHTKLIPASMTSMGDRRPSILRFWPSWVSWLAGILSALLILKAGAWIDSVSNRSEAAPTVVEAAGAPNSK